MVKMVISALGTGKEKGKRKAGMLGTGKESVWVWGCVGKEKVQTRLTALVQEGSNAPDGAGSKKVQ
jgi:hypothetical protein